MGYAKQSVTKTSTRRAPAKRKTVSTKVSSARKKVSNLKRKVRSKLK